MQPSITGTFIKWNHFFSPDCKIPTPKWNFCKAIALCESSNCGKTLFFAMKQHNDHFALRKTEMVAWQASRRRLSLTNFTEKYKALKEIKGATWMAGPMEKKKSFL